MLQPGKPIVAVAHRVERQDMNGSLAIDTGLAQKPPPLHSPCTTSDDQPLDLTKPLDLSQKPSKTNHVVRSSNGGPLAGHLLSRGHQAQPISNMAVAEKSAKSPLLGSTRYPLQRGLAYVQPRQVRQSRQIDVNDTQIPSLPIAPNPSPERLSPDQLKPQKDYTAMHQRVRAEAANIAALQAQATQAAQAAVSKALARQQALAAQDATAGMGKRNIETPPRQKERPVRPTQNGHPKAEDSRKSFQPHGDRLASIKPQQRPEQRHLTPEEMKAYMMQRHFAQLSARRGIQTEQDLLRAYQSLTGVVSYPPHGLTQLQKGMATSSQKNGSKPAPRNHTLPRPREVQQSRELAKAQTANSPQKTVSDHIDMSKSGSFAAQVKAREQAMIKQQQDLLLRRQRQMMDDVNNNRKLLEYARKEKEREAMIRDLNYQQYASLAKAQLERYLPKDHSTQKVTQVSPNQEYLKAMAAYNALYASQKQTSLLSNPSPPPPVGMSVHHKKPPPHIPRRVSSGSGIKPRTVQQTQNNALAVKRPAVTTHSEMAPPKKQMSLPSVPTSNATTAQSDEAKRVAFFEKLMLHSPKEKTTSNKPTLFPTEKKLSSMPVKDRLELARRKVERGHQEAMFLSKCAELMQSRLLGYPLPNSTAQSSSNSLGEILRIPDEEKGPSQPALAALQNDIAKRISQQTSTVSITAPHFKASTGDSTDPTVKATSKTSNATHPGVQEAQEPSKRERRLPSYEDAVAQRNMQDQRKAPETIPPDVMSSVAKRLVSSSQEWLKEYMTREKESHAKEGQETVVDKVMHEKDFALRIPRSIPTSTQNDSPSLPKSVKKVLQSVSSSTIAHSKVNKTPVSISSSDGHTTENKAVTDDTSDHKKVSSTPRSSGLPYGSEIQSVLEKPPTVHSVSSASFEMVSSSATKPSGSVPCKDETGSTRHGNNTDASGVQREQASQQSSGTLPETKDHRSEHDLMQADAATLGKEERALQRAIIRFNDLEKQTIVGGSTQETEPQMTDLTELSNPPASIATRRRRRRKLSKFRRRIRVLRNMTIPSGQDRPNLPGRKRGRPRLSAPPPTSMENAAMRNKFQDFVPTILDHRTRNAGTDRIRNYRAMYDSRNVRYELEIEKERARKVLERHRRMRECGNLDSASATETEELTPEEDCLPPVTKRPRGRPRQKSREQNGQALGGKVDAKTATTSSSTSSERGSRVSQASQPLRVVLDENSSNHIKMKFVKVGGKVEYQGGGEKVPPQARRRGRPPKAAGKRKTKTKHVEQHPTSPQPPKLEMIRPRDDDKENESDYEDFVQDPDFDAINPEKTSPEYTRVVRPDPPSEMKKILVNKKLGETTLHRAATLGSLEMTAYCVDYRVVDINVRDNAGYTALHESCVNGHLNIAQYLLSHGADVNASAADGTRPIHDAVDNDRVEMVRLLLAYGADPFLPTNTGRSTTKLALGRSNEMKTLLFGYLQDVNGDRSKLDNAPTRPLDYQWSFGGSCSLFDAETDGDTYIFADVPGPEGMDTKSASDEDGIFFETSENPVLPSFNLRIDGYDKFRNWVLLDQVLDRLSMTREELEAAHANLRPVTLPADQFRQSVQESQVSRSTVSASCDDSDVKGERVTLVELDNGLRRVLGVDVDYLR